VLVEMLREASVRPPAAEFTIAGVVEDLPEEIGLGAWEPALADVLLPADAAEAWHFREPANRAAGLPQVTLLVDHEDHLRQVHDAVKEMGLGVFSLAEFVEQLQLNVAMIRVGTGLIAFIALLVSALGITNTLLMSVLERTREIGIMKAVGARDG